MAFVAVVAASPVVRRGLAQILGEVPRLTVSHQVDSIDELPGPGPGSLVVVDLFGRGGRDCDDGFWSRLPGGSRAVALCRTGDPPDLITAMRGGVHALLTRDCGTDELIAAVEIARDGGLYVAAELVGPVTVDASRRDTGRRPDLTSREIETLTWVARGLTHEQISRRMALSEATVSTYVKRVRHKLNAGNKAELTRRAIQLGYVDAG